MIRLIIITTFLLLSVPSKNSYSSEIQPNCQIVILKGIYYESGSSKISPEAEITLRKVVQAMNNIKDLRISLTPHVDSIEYLKYGKKLAHQRLKGVVDFLNKEGIGDTLIVKESFKNSYVVPNNNEENKALNRWVEFKVVE